MKRIISLLFIAACGSGCALWDTHSSQHEPVAGSGAESITDSVAESSPLDLSLTQVQQASADDHRMLPDSLRLIAADFAHALRQLEPLTPENTTIHLAADLGEDPFIRAVRDALSEVGYAIRWTQHDNRAYLLQYRTQREASNRLTTREVFELAIGGVGMRRTYAIDLQGRVTPQSPMFIRGADATGIILDDSVFEHQPAAGKTPRLSASDQSSEVRVPASSASLSRFPDQPLAAERPLPSRPATIGQLTRSGISPLDPIVSGERSKPVSLPLVSLPVIDNVFDRGESNFDEFLSDYNVVEKQVLTFANDSLRLGKFNKQVLARMVGRFQEDTDMFSVLGCSMGPTSISGGNAALALGRANRVVEALLFAGISTERILDEGCWAGSRPIDELPSRGVVVTLNRKEA